MKADRETELDASQDQSIGVVNHARILVVADTFGAVDLTIGRAYQRARGPQQ
jgi:hypothetical protein